MIISLSSVYICVVEFLATPLGSLVWQLYHHLQLANTEEYIEGQLTGQLGDVLIR